MSLVSIIIPAYNAQRQISQCIKSIQEQTYKNIEIIVINDGSKDDTLSCCKELATLDSRIRVVDQHNKGVSETRNYGIQLAKGAYIMFADADDYLEAEMIEMMVQHKKTNSLLIAGYYVDTIGTQKKTVREVTMESTGVSCVSRAEVMHLYSKGLLGAVWNKLYERDILIENKILFQKDMSLGEDIVFNLNYISKLEDKIYIINKPLYHYIRTEEESLDNKYNERFNEFQKQIFETFLDQDYLIDARNQIYCLYFNASVVAIDNLYVNREKLPAEEYKKRKKTLISDKVFKEILSHLSGSSRLIYSCRYMLVRICHPLDFYLREIVKKIVIR